MSRAKIIEIEPLTRVEGHGKVSIHLDEANQVQEARLHIVEFRGFERFIHGRPYWEAPMIVQRLCGICPVSHNLAAAKAMDMITGAKRLTPTAEKIRRLAHYGQILQSHVLHFFYLCSPDLLFGFGADVNERNVFTIIKQKPELAMQAIMMRKFGQEVIRATFGKKIHGSGAVPGGVVKNLSIPERDALLKEMDQMLKGAAMALAMARDYTVENQQMVERFGSFPSSFLSLVRDDGALDLYHGNLRAIDSVGNIIFDQVDYQDYGDYIMEEVKPWSYMKFPFIKKRGHLDGWYRVGPLARLNCCGYIDTPKADKALAEFKSLTGGKPNHMTLAYHWARMVEVTHCVEKIGELLEDPDLLGNELLTKGERAPEGIGVIEAPRGTLFHHYRVDKDDLITHCNLIVSTTNNNEAINRSIRQVARASLSGVPKITQGMLNHIEVAVRAYDPCLSCATHALGQMPLVVELYNHKGDVMDRLARG
ncbi:MAG: Ni/Fe hydrogenase subunit alpha [Nitrospinota bacterium]|nr:Ni/Fe hydrogenase subunit alpha [Nitrospinota bacterium]MDH5755798.1 Ni/Fe hydrogenase subunit alpha [Nitrospinota bacterium]